MDVIDRMLEHDRWATTQLLDVCRGLTDEQLDEPFDVGHQTLRATLSHIVINIGFWTGLMLGQPVDDASPSDQSLAELIDRHGRAYDAFAEAARRFRDEGRLDETFIDHYDVAKSMAGTIIHVVQHNLEHRTEALHILQRLGVPDVPEVDHGLWDYETLAAGV
jgi:uncharacterized damage-inducible protein DinB